MLLQCPEDVWISLVEDLIRCQPRQHFVAPRLYRYLDLFQTPLIKEELALKERCQVLQWIFLKSGLELTTNRRVDFAIL